MKPLEWARWRLRAPSSHEVAATHFGSIMGWEEGRNLQTDFRFLKSLGFVDRLELRCGMWSFNAAMWALSAEGARSGGVSRDELDQFFVGFWPAFRREAEANLQGTEYINRFDEDVGRLFQVLVDRVEEPDPTKKGLCIGRTVKTWIGSLQLDNVEEVPRDFRIDSALGIFYLNKLIAITNLLHTIRPQTEN